MTLIKREDAIEALRGLFDMRKSRAKIIVECFSELIKSLPSAGAEWIPVSEALPEKDKEVLISLEWGVDIGQYDGNGWRSEWVNHYDDDNVLAWQSLPKPYREENEE